MRPSLAVLTGAFLLAALPALAQGTGWRPPTTSMPEMPAMAGFQGSWRAALGPWLGSMARASGVAEGEVRAAGDATGRGDRARFVRLTSGYFPVGTWADRNGDGRCDMVEVFREGARVAQLVDADYDGRANVLRLYGASGELVDEVEL